MRHLLAQSVAAAALGILISGCSVQVNKDQAGRDADVDVRTPVGSVSVKATEQPADTGLKTYPGARLARNDDHAESANVKVNGGRLFGVTVAASKFESDDSPEAIAEFYRSELKAFGEVVECHGNIDFPGGPAAHAVCRDERSAEHKTQLAVGTHDNQRIVAITPRGRTTEFALVHVDTRRAD